MHSDRLLAPLIQYFNETDISEILINRPHEIWIEKKGSCQRLELLEFSVREILNKTAPRVMGVLNPVKLVITNYPKGKVCSSTS